MQELLRADRVMRNINSLSKGSAAKTRNLLFGATGSVLVFMVVMHFFSSVAVLGWISALIVQVIFLLTSVFSLVVLMEYQDRQGYEAADVERLMNPLVTAEVVVRLAQILEALHLGCYWLAAIFVPLLVYEVAYRQVSTVDATRLWKDIQVLLKEAKIKLGINTVLFFVVMFAMVLSFITNAFRTIGKNL